MLHSVCIVHKLIYAFSSVGGMWSVQDRPHTSRGGFSEWQIVFPASPDIADMFSDELAWFRASGSGAKANSRDAIA